MLVPGAQTLVIISMDRSRSRADLDPSTLTLLDRKLNMSIEDNDGPPPPVPHKRDPDAPPVYQPANGNGNGYSSSSGPSTESTVVNAHDAYNQLNTLPTGSAPPARPPGAAPSLPMHSAPTANEVSIPFYSNPPPGPDHPALQADRKLPILDDVQRPGPSREITDRPPRFGCLTLHSNDKLGATNLPSEVMNDLDRVIRAKWSKGVQKWAYEDGGWCWQLNGKPCTSCTSSSLLFSLLRERQEPS